MTAIEMLLPAPAPLAPDELERRLAIMRHAQHFAPFDSTLLKLAADFSQRLLNDPEARGFPELQALGFWLRPAAVERMKKNFAPKAGTIAVPHGLAFHIPPAKIDTMFAYSLFVSLLCGSANVIRLPSHRSSAMMLLVRLLGETFSEVPAELRDQLLVIGYAHDNAITETISRACDVRVIWGGDTAVEAIRAVPLAASGRELIFPDRFSWSAFDLEAYRALDEAARQDLAGRFFNDLLWFDQQGCASPRVIVWRGKADAGLTEDFYRRVANVAATKNWRLDEGGSAMKQTRNYEAMIDVPVIAVRDFGSVLTVFPLTDLSGLQKIRKNPGFGGTLFEFFIRELSDIVGHAERRDQTLAHFGFTEEALDEFVGELNGRGFDRLVPVGEALTFDAVWDGYDLPEQFTRRMRVRYR